MSAKKAENGKSYCFWTQYTDLVTGKKKRQYKSGFKTLREAKEAERDFLSSLRLSRAVDMTFEALAEDFLSHKKGKVEINTYKNDVREVNMYLYPKFRKRLVETISRIEVRNWVDYITLLPKSTKYKNEILQLFKGIYKHGKIYFSVINDPCSIVEAFKSDKSVHENVKVWEVDEFEKFISTFDLKDKNQYLWATFFTLLYWTGQRRGEIKALKFSDISFENRTLNVTKSVSQKITGMGTQLRDTKTVSSRRVISLDDSTLAMLTNVLRMREREPNFSLDEFIFIRSVDDRIPYADTTITNRKNLHCILGKVKRITIHQFRHSHASVLICNDVNIAAVSKRLGHSNINMTLKVYTHLIPSVERGTLDTLNKLHR